MSATSLTIRHVLYPLWARRNRSLRLRYLAELEKSQWESPEALRERQWIALRRVVAHAFESCAYYRDQFRAAGVTPADLEKPEDIARLPTITKEEIQEHRDELVSDRYPKSTLIRDMTGGSTGSPMQFYYDSDRLDSRTAATLRHNRWAGWNIGDRAAILWGAPRDTQGARRIRDRVRSWILERRLVLDASSLDEAAMDEFASRLRTYRPKVLLAYANTLGLFARHVTDRGIEGIRPQGIICSAEVLTPQNRELIERTFHCPVFDRYGSREFAVIASECAVHEGLHVNAENLWVETLANGEIVITDLKNLAMPMIRYRTRDTGTLEQGTCSCGRGLPLMKLSGGRTTDFLVSTSGKKVSGIVLATYVITNLPGVRQIQFVQEQRGAVRLNVVKGQAWSEQALAGLLAKTREFLGADLKIDVEYRESIPLEKSGKYRFSISTIS